LAGWTDSRFVWADIWLVIGVVSLWVGGRVLLGYDGPGAVD
jgi:hypothetical protein